MIRIFGHAVGVLSVVALVATVASLPWMLGGVVPLARLVLLVGSIAAAILSVISCACLRRLPDAVPAVVIPLVAMALLGTLQLFDADVPLASEMQHSINPPALLPGSTATHTLSPADTRNTVSILLSLALLGFATFCQFRSAPSIVAAGIVLIINALIVAGIGMSQVFGAREFSWNARWMLGWSHGKNTFAGFVNPNNAAGWLCLAVAIAAGWSVWFSKPSATSPRLRRGRLRISFAGRIWQRTVERMAELTVWQTLMFAATAFAAAGVAATQSRGGILALVIAVVVTALSRTTIRQLPLVIVALCVAAVGSFGFLRWLDLDREVVQEMQTLEDIGEASSVRTTHWLDTLSAVKDFPLIGAGLGSYRFANTAYQSHDARVWFTYADNHYVDMLIEGGVIGLLLFLGVGVCGLVSGFAAWKVSRAKKLNNDREGTRVSRRLLTGIGVTAVLATLSQAVAAFFDYGVGLPAASSLLVVLIGATCGFVYANQPSPEFLDTGAVNAGRLPSFVLLAGLIAAACVFVPDQYHATQIDDVVVNGYRILNPPFRSVEFNRIRDLRRTLGEKLQHRPDDPDGLRLLCRLAEAEVRWNVVSSDEKAFEDEKSLRRIWEQASLRVFLRELKSQVADDPVAGAARRRELQDAIAAADLRSTIEFAQRRYPFTPELPTMAAAAAIADEDMAELERQVSLLRFIAPSKSDSLFEMGAFALLADRKDLAELVWGDSLKASNSFRPSMLRLATTHWTQTEALRRFGPSDYAAAVEAARGAVGRDLSEALWNLADEFWSELKQPVSASLAAVRLTHLESRSPETVDSWLEKILKVHSEDVPLNVYLARRLQKNGRFKDALSQWHKVQFLDPSNEAAQKAIAAISEAEAE